MCEQSPQVFQEQLAFSGQRKSPRGQNDRNTKWGIYHVFGVHILNSSDLSPGMY